MRCQLNILLRIRVAEDPAQAVLERLRKEVADDVVGRARRPTYGKYMRPFTYQYQRDSCASPFFRLDDVQ